MHCLGYDPVAGLERRLWFVVGLCFLLSLVITEEERDKKYLVSRQGLFVVEIVVASAILCRIHGSYSFDFGSRDGAHRRLNYLRSTFEK